MGKTSTSSLTSGFLWTLPMKFPYYHTDLTSSQCVMIKFGLFGLKCWNTYYINPNYLWYETSERSNIWKAQPREGLTVFTVWMTVINSLTAGTKTSLFYPNKNKDAKQHSNDSKFFEKPPKAVPETIPSPLTKCSTIAVNKHSIAMFYPQFTSWPIFGLAGYVGVNGSQDGRSKHQC